MLNNPIHVSRDIKPFTIVLRSMWEVTADETYQVNWPKDRLLDKVDGAIVAVYCTDGFGTVTLANQDVISIPPNTVTFLNAKNIISYGTLGDCWALHWFEFTVLGIINIPFNNPIPHSGNDFFLIDKLKEHFEECTRPVELQVANSCFAYLFFQWIANSTSEIHSDSNRDLIENAVSIMKQNLREQKSIKEISNQIGISEQYFRKLFFKYYSMTPKKYYLRLRLEEGERLIQTSNMNLKSISKKLGFVDSFHFSRTFKTHFNQSPSDYIKTLKLEI